MLHRTCTYVVDDEFEWDIFKTICYFFSLFLDHEERFQKFGQDGRIILSLIKQILVLPDVSPSLKCVRGYVDDLKSIQYLPLPIDIVFVEVCEGRRGKFVFDLFTC